MSPTLEECSCALLPTNLLLLLLHARGIPSVCWLLQLDSCLGFEAE